MLRRIAQIGRPGATLAVQINASLLDDPNVRTRLLLPPSVENATSGLSGGYAAAGIQLIEARVSRGGPQTSWNRRLSRGRPRPILSLHGIIMASGDSMFRSTGEEA